MAQIRFQRICRYCAFRISIKNKGRMIKAIILMEWHLDKGISISFSILGRTVSRWCLVRILLYRGVLWARMARSLRLRLYFLSKPVRLMCRIMNQTQKWLWSPKSNSPTYPSITQTIHIQNIFKYTPNCWICHFRWNVSYKINRWPIKLEIKYSTTNIWLKVWTKLPI